MSLTLILTMINNRKTKNNQACQGIGHNGTS